MSTKPIAALFVLLGSSLAVFSACGSDSDKDEGSNIGQGGTPPIDIGQPTETENGAIITGTIVGDGGVTEVDQETIDELTSGECAEDSGVATSTGGGNLQLVIDNSLSMEEESPGNNVTKWEATRDALLEAIVGVSGPGLAAESSVGMLLYPNRNRPQNGDRQQDVSACINVDAMVPMAELGDANAAQRTRIRDALLAPRQGTGTPTHDAFAYAYATGLQTAPAGETTYMLLITDGEPTINLGCVDGNATAPIIDSIAAAYGAGVPTFVIGSPGSESSREWLSEAAEAGGTALTGCNTNAGDWCHMDMTTAPDFSAALQAGLGTVTSVVGSACSYTIPAVEGQAVDLGQINVFLTDGTGNGGTLVMPDADAGCGNGGWWLNAEGQIDLCESTCATVQENPGLQVRVSFGCTTIVDPTIITK